jgi:hypothetical protein
MFRRVLMTFVLATAALAVTAPTASASVEVDNPAGITAHPPRCC